MSTNAPAATPFDWKSLIADSLATVRSDLLPTKLELPALPQAVTEFIQKAANPDFDVAQLAAIVERDPTLTFELLKHVNSAFYALRQPLRSVHNAIVHVGINCARMHLLAVGLKAATQSKRPRLINHRNFWNESLQKALFAREIAKCMRLDAGLAFLSGLLQDYLLPALTNTFDQEYLQYLSVHAEQGTNLATWERETFGFDHAAAGAIFASQWHFPEDLLCGIFFHHSPETILQKSDPEFLKLFPSALAALLPDQLRQSPTGFQTLLTVARQCPSIDLTEVCRVVDTDQMKMADGFENPNHLSQLLVAAQRARANQ